MIKIIWTLLHWKQWLRGSMLTLNAVVQIQKMLKAKVTQIQQLSQKKIKKLYKLILANHKLKLRKVADELKVSEDCVFAILYRYLSMRKLYSKWVLHLLTVDQKQQCINNSERCLQLFQHNKKEFLHKYVIMDETWIHHFTQESN